MSQIPVKNGLESLKSWWAMMGVDADDAAIKAYLAVTDRATSGAHGERKPHGETRAATRPAETPAGQAGPGAAVAAAPAKRRRKGEKTPEEWAQVAADMAAGCDSLPALKAAIEAFEGCPLKEAATHTVVYDGVPGAPVMVIGEGPGRDEDRVGRPFVGRAGQLLDRMLAAIDLSRDTNALITNVNYWQPPRNRNPDADELRVCMPFVHRMVELSRPRLIIAAGAVPAKALLGTETGIRRLRGQDHTFTTTGGVSARLVPIYHPAYLHRQPGEKAMAWRDLQMIRRAIGPHLPQGDR